MKFRTLFFFVKQIEKKSLSFAELDQRMLKLNTLHTG